MEKQQQILQMAKDICRVKLNCNDVCNPISACDALKYAARAVEAGYVKVVRCKDCKYKTRTVDGEYNPEDIVCGYFMTDGLEENDYCSRGIREEQK
jgi:hypothetical protein